jgi:Arc/MetJ-type ribon-helix-helix transcriptional regulator
MTVNVSKDVEESIRAAVLSGRFPSVDDAVTAAWLAFERSGRVNDAPQVPAAGREQGEGAAPPGILEMVDELRRQVPPEEFAKLPPDGARQLDHYIYGSPKRPTA